MHRLAKQFASRRGDMVISRLPSRGLGECLHGPPSASGRHTSRSHGLVWAFEALCSSSAYGLWPLAPRHAHPRPSFHRFRARRLSRLFTPHSTSSYQLPLISSFPGLFAFPRLGSAFSIRSSWRTLLPTYTDSRLNTHLHARNQVVPYTLHRDPCKC